MPVMGDNNTDESIILISTYDSDIYFKAYGHITANLCFPLRDLILSQLDSFSCSFNIYFDLSEVRYMDSTFLGLLVGMEKKIGSTFANKHLFICNASEIAVKLLKNMGIDRFLNFLNKEMPKDLDFKLFDETIEISELEKCKLVLSSHEELMEISDENKKKFDTLHKILKDQIKNME